jgi:ribosomal protein S18 acetylase RimI-like enzyme
MKHSTPVTIREATPEDVAAARRLFREYADWLGVDLSFQSFDEELAGLPQPYTRPHGFLLFAESAGAVVGCVAAKKLGDGLAEAKRLYVIAEYRGRGIGRQLMERLLRETQEIGYRAVRLDTLPQMQAARRLYKALGFRRIAAYYHNPIAGTVYMERSLV